MSKTDYAILIAIFLPITLFCIHFVHQQNVFAASQYQLATKK